MYQYSSCLSESRVSLHMKTSVSESIQTNPFVSADSLLRLKTLGLYEANDPKKLGHEYGKSIFDLESDTVCDVSISQH